MNVKIPAGISDGLQMQVRGDGDAGERGAPPGNLFVRVRVKDHAYFKRNEHDIILDIGVNVAQAALGDRMLWNGGGLKSFQSAGTQTGKVFRLRGKGFRVLRSGGSSLRPRDSLSMLKCTTPTQYRASAELFEQLATPSGARSSADRRTRLRTGDDFSPAIDK